MNSPEELLALSIPVELDAGDAVCDLIGCDRPATVVIPEAALCAHCLQEHIYRDESSGLDLYDIPLDEVVTGGDWEVARRSMYLERLGQHPGFERRIASLDRRLDEIASDAVDELLEDPLLRR